jgi:hypothetical protein
MNDRLPQLSPIRLLAKLLLPLVAYLLIRAVIGSATGALAITTAIPAIWLLGDWIIRRRLDPVGVIVLVTAIGALAVFAMTGGDPLALKLRRGAVTGPIGIVALASIALGRPLLLLVAENVARLNPDRRADLEARMADPSRRRFVTILTAIVGVTFTIDGVSQIALAIVVPTGSFVADSTVARVADYGIGLIIAAWYIRHQRDRIHRGPRPPARAERGG